MSKPIHILLLDDVPEYRSSFKTQAQQKRLITDAVDNTEYLVEVLRDKPGKHQFVVLDAKAFAKEGQTKGTEHESQLFKAFRDISKIENEQNRTIPFCVNTGFAEIELNYQEDVLGCKIFKKGNEDKLFDYIWEVYNNSDHALLRKKYRGAFEFADKYYDDISIPLLSKYLNNDSFASHIIEDRIQNLATLRRLVEHTTDKIFEIYFYSVSGIIQTRSTRIRDIANHLKNNEIIPSHIYGAVINITKAASNYGSHTPESASKIEDYPTANTLQSLTLGFIDFIEWAYKLLEPASARK